MATLRQLLMVVLIVALGAACTAPTTPAPGTPAGGQATPAATTVPMPTYSY